MSITEQQLETAAIGWFRELGWQYAAGPDIAPDGGNPVRTDYRQVVLQVHLLAALTRINSHIPVAALEQATHELLTVSEPLLIARNRRVHRLLLAGIPVEFSVGEEKHSDLVNLIDFAEPRNNDFLLVSQFTVTGTKQPRRPDLVAFVNGLPLAVIELKNPANEQTDIWDAFNQIQTYKEEISDLFNTNVAVVVSDGFTARLGSLTANQERMQPWRAIANEDDRPLLEFELETLVRGFFEPALFLDYVRHFVLFEQDADQIIKKIAGYHQFHAVREAVKATVIAASNPNKGLLEVQEPRATYGKEVQPGRPIEAGDRARADARLFDYSGFETSAMKLLVPVANHILGLKDGKQRFLDAMLAVSKAFSLCSTLDEAAALRTEIAFFAVVKAAIVKFTTVDRKRSDADKNSALKQILDNAIVADGVADIFALAGLDKPNIGLLSDEFLEDVRELGDDILKKIAIEITEKLRNSTTVDWQVRESVRAKLRILVRRTLKKWKYPPDKQPEAMELVLKQAELLSNVWSG